MKYTIVKEDDAELVKLGDFLSLISTRWKISRDAIAKYLKDYKEDTREDIDQDNFDAAIITQTVNGNKSPKKIKVLFETLEALFYYDFAKKRPKEGFNDLHKRVRERIINFYSEDVSLGPIKKDFAVVDMFKGLYYGCAYNLDKSLEEGFFSFLFRIRADSSVELASKEEYYQKGYITSIGNNIYFLLNSEDGKQPELYITGINQSLRKKNRKIKQFMMCGTWISRKDVPAFGACVLIKRSLSNTLEPDTKSAHKDILESVEKNASVKGINDIVYDEIKKDTDLLQLHEKMLKDNIYTYFLNDFENYIELS